MGQLGVVGASWTAPFEFGTNAGGGCAVTFVFATEAEANAAMGALEAHGITHAYRTHDTLFHGVKLSDARYYVRSSDGPHHPFVELFHVWARAIGPGVLRKSQHPQDCGCDACTAAHADRARAAKLKADIRAAIDLGKRHMREDELRHMQFDLSTFVHTLADVGRLDRAESEIMKWLASHRARNIESARMVRETRSVSVSALPPIYAPAKMAR